MATFKVGDRVRRARQFCGGDALPVSATGTVAGLRGQWVEVYWDAPNTKFNLNLGGWAHWTLEPLTPPAEDTWAADKVKQVTKPQHIEPVAPKREPIAA